MTFWLTGISRTYAGLIIEKPQREHPQLYMCNYGNETGGKEICNMQIL